MRYRFAALIFAISFIIQSFILGSFAIAGANTNLILCFGVVIAFSYPDDTSSVVIGGIFALIYDICFSLYPGMGTVPYLITVTVCMLFKYYILNNENKLSMAIVSVLSVVLAYNLYWAAAAVTGIATSYISMLSHLPVYIILNIPVMYIAYLVIVEKNVRYRQDRYRRWESI